MKTLIAITGSFNPVTVAHYRILSDAVEKYHADEGIFITTSDEYLTKKCLLKNKQPTTMILPAVVRGKMLSSLSLENPRLSYWGTELGGADSNTYGTLRKLYRDKQKQYPGEEIRLFFLFGADKLRAVPHWKHPVEIITLCEFLVYARKFDLESVIAKDPFLTSHRDRIHLMNVDDEDLEDVSSTEVRRRFFTGEDYRPFMNDGPYRLMQELSPADYPPVHAEDRIRANILYGGRFGKNTARSLVYRENTALFQQWNQPWLGNREEHRKALVYRKPWYVVVSEQPEPTVTGCANADCVDVAESLIKEHLHPAILNLASRTNPGGGYPQGADAQEESLCRMSTLSQSLYQFGNPKYKHIRDSGVTPVPGVYPMDINYGGIYSPCVTFFRHNINRFFSVREEPFDCPVISVASLSNRESNEFNTYDERNYFRPDGFLTEDGREIERNKIRTIFRMALENGRDSLVLGAFGCGVYHLQPLEVSGLFSEILQENEFRNRFRKIVFAIYEGKPTARHPDKEENGKFKPFYDQFGKL